MLQRTKLTRKLVDPNLYLWLSAFLNFSLITAPDAWSSAPSPLLTGPITAITADAVKSRYKPDPSANMLPSDIIILTTATVSSLSPRTSTSSSASAPSSTSKSSSTSTFSPSSTFGSSSTPSSSSTSSSGGDRDGGGEGSGQGVGGALGNDVLTILYYAYEDTRMYVVGPASEVGSLLPASATVAASTSGASATTTALPVAVTTAGQGYGGGGGSVTTGKFVQGGRTVLIVGPSTGTRSAIMSSGAGAVVDGVGLREFWGWAIVVGVISGVAFLGGAVF